MKKIKILLSVIIFIILVVTLNFALKNSVDKKLDVTTYNLKTEKLHENTKIAFLSDLHSNDFGDGNGRLVREIEAFSPDVILMGGDMVNKDDSDISTILNLCERLKPIADIYYIYGNHEGVLEYSENGQRVPIDRELLNRGVKVCYGGIYRIKRGNDKISMLCIPADGKEYKYDPALHSTTAEFMESEDFKLVLTHYPDILYEHLYEENFDLGLAGHYHGGQIRLGEKGLFHIDTGFFPPYSGGKYTMKNSEIIVSRGLGNGIPVARINNNPELVLIDIKREEN